MKMLISFFFSFFIVWIFMVCNFICIFYCKYTLTQYTRILYLVVPFFRLVWMIRNKTIIKLLSNFIVEIVFKWKCELNAIWTILSFKLANWWNGIFILIYLSCEYLYDFFLIETKKRILCFCIKAVFWLNK